MEQNKSPETEDTDIDEETLNTNVDSLIEPPETEVTNIHKELFKRIAYSNYLEYMNKNNPSETEVTNIDKEIFKEIVRSLLVRNMDKNRSPEIEVIDDEEIVGALAIRSDGCLCITSAGNRKKNKCIEQMIESYCMDGSIKRFEFDGFLFRESFFKRNISFFNELECLNVIHSIKPLDMDWLIDFIAASKKLKEFHLTYHETRIHFDIFRTIATSNLEIFSFDSAFRINLSENIATLPVNHTLKELNIKGASFDATILTHFPNIKRCTLDRVDLPKSFFEKNISVFNELESLTLIWSGGRSDLNCLIGFIANSVKLKELDIDFGKIHINYDILRAIVCSKLEICKLNFNEKVELITRINDIPMNDTLKELRVEGALCDGTILTRLSNINQCISGEFKLQEKHKENDTDTRSKISNTFDSTKVIWFIKSSDIEWLLEFIATSENLKKVNVNFGTTRSHVDIFRPIAISKLEICGINYDAETTITSKIDDVPINHTLKSFYLTGKCTYDTVILTRFSNISQCKIYIAQVPKTTHTHFDALDSLEVSWSLHFYDMDWFMDFIMTSVNLKTFRIHFKTQIRCDIFRAITATTLESFDLSYCSEERDPFFSRREEIFIITTKVDNNLPINYNLKQLNITGASFDPAILAHFPNVKRCKFHQVRLEKSISQENILTNTEMESLELIRQTEWSNLDWLLEFIANTVNLKTLEFVFDEFQTNCDIFRAIAASKLELVKMLSKRSLLLKSNINSMPMNNSLKVLHVDGIDDLCFSSNVKGISFDPAILSRFSSMKECVLRGVDLQKSIFDENITLHNDLKCLSVLWPVKTCDLTGLMKFIAASVNLKQLYMGFNKIETKFDFFHAVASSKLENVCLKTELRIKLYLETNINTTPTNYTLKEFKVIDCHYDPAILIRFPSIELLDRFYHSEDYSSSIILSMPALKTLGLVFNSWDTSFLPFFTELANKNHLQGLKLWKVDKTNKPRLVTSSQLLEILCKMTNLRKLELDSYFDERQCIQRIYSSLTNLEELLKHQVI